MSAQIEARRLSGTDLGKTVEGTDNHGRQFNGTLHRVEQRWAAVALQVDNEHKSFTEFHNLAPSDTVTVTGQRTPATGPAIGSKARTVMFPAENVAEALLALDAAS